MSKSKIPTADEVHIHFAHLDLDKAEMTRLERFLDQSERARANRLQNFLARNRFIAGRGFLHETLAGYLGVGPEEIWLAEGEWGKPHLAARAGSGTLSFNLSHAADFAMLAVSRERDVGIDVERVVEELQFHAMARLFLSLRERTELSSLPKAEQAAAFFRCWTRKEAYLKGCGKGFMQPSDSFDVSLLPGQPPALLAHRTFPDDPACWSLLDIPVPPEYFASLAFAGESPVIKLWGNN
jgi:4'-phosphopantetheinyl transferase